MANHGHLYGVFWTSGYTDLAGTFHPGDSWALVTAKAQAVKLARAYGGYCMVVKYGMNGYGPGSWDAPTFKVSADMVSDYR